MYRALAWVLLRTAFSVGSAAAYDQTDSKIAGVADVSFLQYDIQIWDASNSRQEVASDVEHTPVRTQATVIPRATGPRARARARVETCDPAAPRAHIAWMLYTGCSGSSIAWRLAVSLMQQIPHVQLWEAPWKEFLKNKDETKGRVSEKQICPSGSLRWSSDPIERMSQAMNALQERNCSGVTSDIPGKSVKIFFLAAEPWEMRSLANGPPVQLRTVQHTRANVVAQAVCQVRDCFRHAQGYAVDATGNKSDLCFERRFNKASDADYRAHLEPAWLSQLLNKPPKTFELPESAPRDWEPRATATDEDLTLWEYDFGKPALERSVTSWTSFLLGLGCGKPCKSDVESSNEIAAIVRAHLLAEQQTMEPRKAHNYSQLIENDASLRQYLARSDPVAFAKYLSFVE